MEHGQPTRNTPGETSYAEEGGPPPIPSESPREEGAAAASTEEKKRLRREKYERERSHEKNVQERFGRLSAELDTRRQVRPFPLGYRGRGGGAVDPSFSERKISSSWPGCTPWVCVGGGGIHRKVLN